MACGKTSTAMQLAAKSHNLAVDKNLRLLAEINPAGLLDGPYPTLIDEWQLVPQLWNNVIEKINQNQQVGQFILTGSSTPSTSDWQHTGSLRIRRLRMWPMTLQELGHSDAKISLAKLFDGEDIVGAHSAFSFDDLIQNLIIGGWPSHVGMNSEKAMQNLRDYVSSLERLDLVGIETKRKSPAMTKALLLGLARNVSSEKSFAALAREISPSLGPTLGERVADYHHMLTRANIVDDLKIWKGHLRSKAMIVGNHKRYFSDPSLAIAVLGANQATLKSDLETVGLLFENLVLRDLRVFMQALGGDIFFYREKDGLEIDFVLQLSDGRWGLIEVKLGQSQIAAAQKNLRRLEDRIDKSIHGEPSFKAIIYAGSSSYQLADGVKVIAIGNLGL